MKRNRLTYVPLQVAEEHPNLIIESHEEINGAIMARVHDYSILTLIKILHPLLEHPQIATNLYMRSKIRMKRAFYNYLHLCLLYKFLTKEKVGHNVIYTISDKGRQFLDLFIVKDIQPNTL